MVPSNTNAPREGADVRAARVSLFSAVSEKIENILDRGILTSDQICSAIPQLLVNVQAEVHRFVGQVNSGLSGAALADILTENSKKHESEQTNRTSFMSYIKNLFKIQEGLFGDKSPVIKFELFQDSQKVLNYIQGGGLRKKNDQP